MKHLALFAIAACGGSATPAPVEPIVVEERDPTDAADPDDADGEDDGEVEIVSTVGRFDPDEAAARFAPHGPAMNACYADRLARRRWLGGSVELTWSVTGDGVLEHVRVSRSDLGAWPIEACLLNVAREVDFGAPHGRKKAEVTFPVAFSGGGAAVAWDEDQALRAVGGKGKTLAVCGKASGVDPTNVSVTIYVGTRGKVQSVGFAAPQPLPEGWASCAEVQVNGWTLTDPRGKVAKLSYVYNPVDEE